MRVADGGGENDDAAVPGRKVFYRIENLDVSAVVFAQTRDFVRIARSDPSFGACARLDLQHPEGRSGEEAPIDEEVDGVFVALHLDRDLPVVEECRQLRILGDVRPGAARSCRQTQKGVAGSFVRDE